MKFREWLLNEAPGRSYSSVRSNNFRDRRYDQGIFTNFSHEVPPWFTHRFPSLLITAVGNAYNRAMYGDDMKGQPSATGQYIPWNPSARAKKSAKNQVDFGIDITAIINVGSQAVNETAIYQQLHQVVINSDDFKKFLETGAINPEDFEDQLFDIAGGQAILRRRYFVDQKEGMKNNG